MVEHPDTPTQISKPSRSARPPGRIWWQRVLRAVLAGVVFLAAAYLSLPWWLPTTWVRSYLVSSLESQLQVPVEVGKISLSWAEGVQIETLTIASPDGFADRPMVHIDRILAELSPAEMLLHGRIEWMEVIGPTVDVQIDPAGNLNIATLKALQFDIQTDRLLVNEARVFVHPPQEGPTLEFLVSDMQVLQGRLPLLGQMTLTAGLKQESHVAPVSVRLSTGEDQAVPSAEARMHFGNLDLGQLPLPTFLNLPIRSIQGRCRGLLKLQVNSNLEIDQLSLQVLARNLAVQPETGSALPTIDEAGLTLAATVDPFSERLDIRRFHLRLPGVDLSGKASVYSELLAGNLQAIDSVEVNGVVQMDRLGWLLEDDRAFPPPWSVSGPIRLQASTRREAGRYPFTLRVQADDAVLHDGPRIAKQAGTPAVMDVRGAWNSRGPDVSLETLNVTFGDNQLKASVSLSDSIQWIAWAQEQTPTNSTVPWKLLAETRSRGELQIRDLDSLRPILPETPLQDIELLGACTIAWDLCQTSPEQVQLGVRAERDTTLQVGEVALAAGDDVLTVDILGRLVEGESNLREVSAVLQRGECTIRCSEGTVTWEFPENATEPDISGTCAVYAENLDGLAGSVVPAPAMQLSGSMVGQLDLQVSDPGVVGQLTADLKNAGLDCEGWWKKHPGDPLVMDVQFTAPDDEDIWTLQAGFVGGGNQMNVQASARPEEIRANLTVEMENLSDLSRQSPALESVLDGGGLAGPARVETSLRFDDREMHLRGVLSSPGMDCLIGPGGRSVKFRNTPASARWDVSVSPATDDTLRWSLREAAVTFGQQARLSVGVEGKGVCLRPLREGFASLRPGSWPMRGALQWRASVEGVEHWPGHVPATRPWIDAHGLAGSAELQGAIACRDGNLSGRCTIQAGRLGVRDVQGLAKPANLPAEGMVVFSAPADLSRVTVEALRADIDTLHLEADGVLRPALDPMGEPAGPGSLDARWHINLSDARVLGKLLPAWESLGFRGGLESEGTLAAGEELLLEGSIRFNDLCWTWRERDVGFGGGLAWEGLRIQPVDSDGADDAPAKAPDITLERFRTDKLECKAGKNHGWLIADLQTDPDALRGSFHIVVDYLDDRDLTEWLGGTSKETDSGTVGEADLAESAQTVVSEMARRARRARLHGRLHARTLMFADVKINEQYPIEELDIRLDVEGGTVRILYNGGLYGGTVQGLLQTHLLDETPMLVSRSEMVEVESTESIQPQLSLYFPGNTVHGRFSRSEDIRYPLWQHVAASMDPTYRPLPEGTARMEATHGVVIGRAAPTFVTRIFPGLNLAEYRYDRMTAFQTYLPDGKSRNETFFFGDYDMYMEGETGRENRIQYGLGLVLFGSTFSPEALRDWKQGRVPILKIRGRIENGRLVDEEVSYPWPNETLFELFLENNLIYRAWVNLQKPAGPEADANGSPAQNDDNDRPSPPMIVPIEEAPTPIP